MTVSATTANASEPSTNGLYTFTRTGSTTESLTVRYTVDGSASPGSDYTSIGTSVTIPAGQASVTTPVIVSDDLILEVGGETVVVTLSSDTAYTVGTTGGVTVTIADNEVPPPLPTVTVVATANAAEPSTDGVYTFTRTGSTTAALTVNFAVTGTATSGSDYTSIGTSVTIPAGQASATTPVVVRDDSILEVGGETVVVTLSSNMAYTVGTPLGVTVTIADNEVPVDEAAPWTEVFTYANGTTSHGSATTWTATNTSVQGNEMSFNNVGADGVFTTGAINISSGPVSVSLKVRGGPGLDVGQDFLRLYKKVDGGAEVLIAAADGPQAAATWTANISAGSSLVLVVKAHVTSTAEFYYFDDLSVTPIVLPTVTLAATTANAAEPSTNGVYTFTRTGNTTAALTVNYVVTGTATSGTDYTSIGTSVTIPVGQASATKTVAVRDDSILEVGGETVVVTLSSNLGYTVGTSGGVTVTIADDDVGLPIPWVSADIGAVGATGNATYSGSTFTVVGSGADLLGAADAFRYVSQSSSGDCSIVARVTGVQNTNAWAKAGVMIRESTAAGSANIFVFVTPTSGVSLTWRATTSGSTDNSTVAVAGQAAPKWLKLTRAGNVFTAYRSDDGSAWIQVGSPQTISMATTATLGLGLTSHAAGTLCTSTMDNVTGTP